MQVSPRSENQTFSPVKDGTLERIPWQSLSGREFYRRFRKPGRPVVLTGLLEAGERWDLEGLCAQLGHCAFSVRHSGPDHFKLPKHLWTSFGQWKMLTLNQYAELLANRRAHKDNIVMAQVPLNGMAMGRDLAARIRELGSWFGLKKLLPQMDLFLWLSPSGHREPLHFDEGDGTLLQLHGRKRITLFPPEQSRNLYPFPFFGAVEPWVSRIDPEQPDLARFPKAARAMERGIQVEIGPGDLLYIPLMWWHEVKALGEDYVLSVSRLWKVKPRLRNFCTSRSTIFYLKRKLPQKLLFKLYYGLKNRRGR